MKKNLKFKKVFGIITLTLLICLLPVSATADCASNKVYTEVVTNQSAGTNNNADVEKAVEAAKAEAIAKAEEAAKSAEPTVTVESNEATANTNANTDTSCNNETASDTANTDQTVNTAETTNTPETTGTPSATEPVANDTEAPKAPANTNNNASMQDIEKQVADLVNQARRENGLNELTLNEELSNVARVKANDMANNKYFSHNSPTYGSPFDMMKQFGISFRTAGENIAMGQTTAQQVFDGWMNSEGHRANILNPNFTQIGVGYTSNGNYWSQMFIG